MNNNSKTYILENLKSSRKNFWKYEWGFSLFSGQSESGLVESGLTESVIAKSVTAESGFWQGERVHINIFLWVPPELSQGHDEDITMCPILTGGNAVLC